MSPRFTPTVRQLQPCATARASRRAMLRLGLGAVVAGAALTAVPAMADAASSCRYDTSQKAMVVTDGSGAEQLRIFRFGEQIRFADGTAASQFCVIPGRSGGATVTNTERIVIGRNGGNIVGGVHVDQSGGVFGPGATPESDGQSEVEIATVDGFFVPAPEDFARPNVIKVTGTPGYDVMAVGQRGKINLGWDPDIDIDPATAPDGVTLLGGEGGDDITGNGLIGVTGGTEVGLFVDGQGGNDMIVGGFGHDELRGGLGDDRFFGVDLRVPGEGFRGDGGFDTATTDANDFVDSIEKRTISSQSAPIGQLKLASPSVQAKAGKTTRLKLSWTHPTAWRELRAVTLRVYAAGAPVGAIVAKPGRERLRDRGKVKLMAADSRLSHTGKTVTADLAVRLPRSLAGQDLRLEVEAVDRKGNRQVEPTAGAIRLAQ